VHGGTNSHLLHTEPSTAIIGVTKFIGKILEPGGWRARIEAFLNQQPVKIVSSRTGRRDGILEVMCNVEIVPQVVCRSHHRQEQDGPSEYD
jgi:hypothetical protein